MQPLARSDEYQDQAEMQWIHQRFEYMQHRLVELEGHTKKEACEARRTHDRENSQRHRPRDRPTETIRRDAACQLVLEWVDQPAFPLRTCGDVRIIDHCFDP